MFTLSKAKPEFIIKPSAHKDLGSILTKFGGRVLLICSMNPMDRLSILKIKEQLTLNKITFIQSDQSESFINTDKLNQLSQRAEIFNVSSIVAVGGICQRMSGKYICEKLSINYIEIPTSPAFTYLLEDKTAFSNRIGNDFEILKVPSEYIKSIIIDSQLHREFKPVDIILESLTILLNLSQLFLSENNNIISKNESLNLFNRILSDLESESIDQEKLYIYSLTAAFYHSSSSDIDLDITLFALTAAYRYNFNGTIACAKLLPALLDESDNHDLAIKVRELLHVLKITTRLTDLGFTLNQLLDVSKNRKSIKTVIEKAF